MSTLNQQATAIANTILTVPDCGKVTDQNPDIGRNDLASFVQQFVIERPGDATRGQIRFWSVGYTGGRGEMQTMAYGAATKNRETDWLVRFFMSWDDTSESVFRDLVEQVVEALDANISLSGTVARHDACRVTTPNGGMGMVLGDYGCHAAEIRMTTLDQTSVATY